MSFNLTIKNFQNLVKVNAVQEKLILAEKLTKVYGVACGSFFGILEISILGRNWELLGMFGSRGESLGRLGKYWEFSV
ncbi:hypothetical protein [Nodularia sp. UHCC 0506]|uniref:hypothetical protein n=1 Tax=Nodularia sp. UHCC 0506 TaxID=3110243 RepID=UPI002B220BFA|nr:hypothetical protein [Nodularia sp. UHCC 0506]MEA5517272.1 hypothetical protein [Nodularia sp. UHCC 0506]